MTTLSRLAAVLLCAGTLAVSPAMAFSLNEETDRQQDDSPSEAARDLALESIEKLMQAMELLLESIPQYEAPEINEDGDIIIRRKREEPPTEDGEAAPEQEET